MNRKLPFGYRMVLGEILPHPQEADGVQAIYAGYLSGASFQSLAQQMSEVGIPYLTGKAWNKNMVARILEDERYTGTDRYPPLIQPEVFRQVQRRRKAVYPPRPKAPAEKDLRRLLGRTPPKGLQETVLALLNGLIQDPQQIRQETGEAEDAALHRQRREVEDALRTLPINEAAARKLALRYAGAALERIGPEEYETQRLRRLFTEHPPMETLDADFLRKTIRRIRYQSGGIELLLQNGQWLKGGPGT